MKFGFSTHSQKLRAPCLAANVLSNPQAVTMSVFVVWAFVKMREALGHNRALAEQLAELERKLTERRNVHEQAIVHVLAEIRKLMEPQPALQPPRREIGFHAKPEPSSPTSALSAARGTDPFPATLATPLPATRSPLNPPSVDNDAKLPRKRPSRAAKLQPCPP